MRISDWSSDVCSSDLRLHGLAADARLEGAQRLADDLAHRHARIEAGQRVLEDDLHVLALGPQRLGVERRQFLAEPDGAPAGRLDEPQDGAAEGRLRSEEHPSELQSPMRISYAGVCLKKKKRK